MGRIAYALLFCVVLPVALAAWAGSAQVDLPGFQAPAVGWALAAAGTLLMARATWELWRRAGALPMNAFPPLRRAESGPFALLDHPIYLAAVLLCAGLSLVTGSGPALWLVTPLLALACAALVLGYEARATHQRLGPRSRPAWLSLAPDDDQPPTTAQRFACWFLIFLPWLILYEGLGHLPVPDGVDVRLPFERSWPVLTWTEAAYVLAYPLTLLAPFLARRRADLRRFEISALVAMALAFWCYLAFPLLAPPRPFDAEGPLARLLNLERADGLDGRVACPSFHVYWALSAAWLWSSRAGPIAWAARAVALAILVSCVSTGMHALLDVAAGVVLFVIAHHHDALWRAILLAAQAIANAWHARHIGPVRVLIHAIYAGAAAFVGFLLADTWAGPDARPWLAGVSLAGLIGAGLWGQALEGGGKLARPFGYFGYALGVAAALAAMALAVGESTWLLAASFVTAAPLVQAIGRLRCLVQGCCHGSPAPKELGIQHHQPLSRVCALTPWCGVALRPAPVYSILSGIAIFGLLIRLWSVHAPASFIAGSYLLLTGLARFVEENARGEPQTRVLAGLRIYQWLSIAFIVAGAALTCIPSPDALRFGAWPAPAAWAWAAAIALLHAFSMGVDFPASTRRFARLAGTA